MLKNNFNKININVKIKNNDNNKILLLEYNNITEQSSDHQAKLNKNKIIINNSDDIINELIKFNSDENKIIINNVDKQLFNNLHTLELLQIGDKLWIKNDELIIDNSLFILRYLNGQNRNKTIDFINNLINKYLEEMLIVDKSLIKNIILGMNNLIITYKKDNEIVYKLNEIILKLNNLI